MSGPPVRWAAVMTVHNRKEHTLACLASLEAQQGFDGQVDVYLTDDGSTDGTGEQVRRRFPAVRVLDGDGALFWNGGMRAAFAAALEVGYDAYLWLNDDVVLDPDALATMHTTWRTVAAQRPTPVIVVGSTRDPDTAALTYGGVVRASRARPLAFRLVPPGAAPRPCDTMNGQCVLIPASAATRVGNLDPGYRHGLGDYDYGLRARRVGVALWVAPGTVGTCARNPARVAGERPVVEEWRALRSVKGLPPSDWRLFARRWAGPLWPVYWLSPYLRRLKRAVVARVRSGSAARSSHADQGAQR